METRTPEELDNPDYNYYLAYIINPAEKDEKKIQDAMEKRKNTFTQGTVVQRRLKDLYNDAIEIMVNDPNRRNIEFENAKEFKQKDAEKAIISVVKNRSTIYQSDLVKMANASGKWLTVDEIKTRTDYLLQQGVTIIDNTKNNLDFFTYGKVEELLKAIGKNDLYDLLGATQNSSVSTLQAAITTTYNSVAAKTDPKSTATNQVCGEAKKVFKDENPKKYYDIYLATKDIWDEFTSRRSYGISEIQPNEFLHYSEKVREALNIADVDFIETLLAEAISFFRFSVFGGTGNKIDLEDCPYCGKAYNNDTNPKACPHCHNQFEILCWNCGGKAPYTFKDKTCPTCGATKDNRHRFDIIIKKMDNLLSQSKVSITDIQAELHNLKILLPDYKKVGTSKLAKAIAEYEETINQKSLKEEIAKFPPKVGIANISYSKSENGVTITGKPHPLAKKITANVGNTAFPNTLNLLGDSVTKSQFINEGLRIKLKMNTDNYITIFTEIENEGVISTQLPEVITIRERSTVLYTMEANVSASKPFSIHIKFQSDKPGTIPELAIVSGSPRPLTKNDGDVVETTPSLTLKKGLFGDKYTANITIKSPPTAMNTKFALFQSEDNSEVSFKEVRSL